MNITIDDNNHDKKNVHFSIVGASVDAIKENFPEISRRLLVKTTIFARMKPSQKESIVGNI